MIALIQRVSEASVQVEARRVAQVGAGLLAFIAIVRGDDHTHAARLLERLLSYRVFADAQGCMNRSLRDIRGALLLVPQFTLAADTHTGSRPGFSTAAPPQQAAALFAHLVQCAQAAHEGVASGEFGAHMQVALINDGPVTFWLETTQ